MAGEKKQATPTHKGRHARPSPPLFSSRKRLATWQKATALVPLALLSGAWTTSMTMAGGPHADAASRHVTRLPDGSTIPSHPLKKPASVTAPGTLPPAAPSKSSPGSGTPVAAGPSGTVDGIPSVALAAYRHAAQVMGRADPGCHLPWQLLAAIGRVESDHGRYGGNVLAANGVAHPGIYGVPLDGSGGTQAVADTDNGRYDHNPVYDRAVGPMQFIPSTWAVVGVDGDGDGVRNPQDINDAALAAGVYLCAGNQDLSTTAGRAAAVYRYNHNHDYVNLVLSIMRSYLAGDYTSAPNQSTAPVVFSPISGTGAGKHRARPHQHHTRHQHAHQQRTPTGGKHRAGKHQTTAAAGTTKTSSGSTGGSSSGSSPLAVPTSSPTATVTKVTQPVVDTLSTTTQAVSFCTSHLPDLSSLSSSNQTTVINDCAAKVKGMTKDKAASVIPSTLDGVLKWLGLTSILNSLLGGSPTSSSSPSGGGSGGGVLGGVGGLLGGS